MTNHFADDVPQGIREKLLTIAEWVKDNRISNHPNAGMGKEAYGCVNLNEISGKSYDGFIAFQSGGYTVTEPYANGWHSGSYFTEDEEKATDEQYQNMLEGFVRDNMGLHYKEAQEWAKTLDCNALDEQTQDDIAPYESDWFEPVLLRFQLWVEDSGNVYMEESINYIDAPYYRTGSDEVLHHQTFTQIDILTRTPEELIAMLET